MASAADSNVSVETSGTHTASRSTKFAIVIAIVAFVTMILTSIDIALTKDPESEKKFNIGTLVISILLVLIAVGYVIYENNLHTAVSKQFKKP